MAVRVQVVFEAETMDEVVVAVRRWLDGSPDDTEPDQGTAEARREREVFAVLAAIKGPDSRQFVRDLAEAAVRGEGVLFDGELKARYGKSTGTAFAGIVGGPNKLMRRIAKRDLIVRDLITGGYRMDPADAAVALTRPVDGEQASGTR